MAQRRAHPHQGWSALTRAHRDAPSLQDPVIPSFSPELSVPDPSEFVPLSVHTPPPDSLPILTFAGVVKTPAKTIPGDFCSDSAPCSTVAPIHGASDADIGPETDAIKRLHGEAVARLHALHDWADVALISDILQSLNLDEDSASAFLISMADDNIQRLSAAPDHVECVSCLQETEKKKKNCLRICSTDEAFHDLDAEGSEDSDNRESSLSTSNSVPIEPEWEDDDLYISSRRNALKMSRISGKHSRGAYRAFVNGDHSRAKLLSKQAREERLEADKLHAEAAKKILVARNAEPSQDPWQLDLHGLHIKEAVAALQERLLAIETGILDSLYLQDGVLSSREKILKKSVFQAHSMRNELKVITGHYCILCSFWFSGT
ncbi:hypothetical protein KP509_16G051200 [Ceratopteris richardii]|uniref:DUF1771 domain-containing protein n=1 Tax=Ceratopteris richardii TaxID=49495 RepID=A0A8T2T4H4_CERRI|nr:hypothetical protein KP509_16G051200 [Ceratopteris richardii]